MSYPIKHYECELVHPDGTKQTVNAHTNATIEQVSQLLTGKHPECEIVNLHEVSKEEIAEHNREFYDDILKDPARICAFISELCDHLGFLLKCDGYFLEELVKVNEGFLPQFDGDPIQQGGIKVAIESLKTVLAMRPALLKLRDRSDEIVNQSVPETP